MERIISKIRLIKKVELFKKLFVNDAIDKGIKTEYSCCNCNSQNEINIILYKTGFPFDELYKNNILTGEDIINNKLAGITNERYMYLGKYTVNNLPTLYFNTECYKCSARFIVVFSYGEKQSGLEICEISGAWHYKQ